MTTAQKNEPLTMLLGLILLIFSVVVVLSLSLSCVKRWSGSCSETWGIERLVPADWFCPVVREHK